VRDFAQFFVDNRALAESNFDSWLDIKGIGPWTVDYAKMRAGFDPDIWLGGDLGVVKALAALSEPVEPESFSPWRSYATFHFWNSLS